MERVVIGGLEERVGRKDFADLVELLDGEGVEWVARDS